MCLVVDSNTVAAVLNKEDAMHHDFAPVEDWIFNGRGKLVYGGKRLRSELAKLKRYQPLLLELERKGKTVSLDDDKIDDREKAITGQLKQKGIGVGDKRFNDAHLVALVATSGVRIVCTRDVSSFRFLRDSAFYEKSTDRPKLYTSIRNRDLLCNQNIASCCK